ncbi:MerR family transcriptional regulator [Actinomadura verrucosospora]|uniref:MerR family transcriptional regulator n=1 Tax=Actinomadura verrucosospora TaxID=46165 RepID=A0A7D3ZNP8_ACTVE|nr:MerR family transcriptional regulator [Actinomadura verrucosospora]QKG22862.1 MerR family transcriptional regulator [Actinomadura verrucosospora]
MDVTWTIGELAERAAAVLAAGESAQVNGRVRDLPNERLIRWYTTIGLVDPPAGRRGRAALYGPRHLLQLVAIKRRQAAGRSIAEIQLELAAATDATLEEIAALPPGAARPDAAIQGPVTTVPALPTSSTSEGETAPRPPEPASQDGVAAPSKSAGTEPLADGAEHADTGPRPQERFWSARPDLSYGRATVAEGRPRPVPSVVQGVRLAPDLTLLLEAGSLSADDLQAIETAARPLLDELAARGLIASPADSVRPPAHPPRRPQ